MENEIQKIGLFVPEATSLTKLDFNRFDNYVGKTVSYAMRGRFSIRNIVKNMLENAPTGKNGVILPAYLCESVYYGLRELNIELFYADIDERDLNISVESINSIVQRENEKILCVIVPSLYGNPANLIEIEEYCRKNEILMIDDAAQAWGSVLDEKMVGTFGNAGLWACSPGKPCGGAYGSLYWINYEKRIIQKPAHMLVHRLINNCYLETRCRVYTNNGLCRKIGSIEGKLGKFIGKIVAVDLDDCSEYDEKLLGGYFWDSLQFVEKRRHILQKFMEKYNTIQLFRVVTNIRGTSHPCKIVLVFCDRDECRKARDYFTEKKVMVGYGYSPIQGTTEGIDTTMKLYPRILELPIELNDEHMDYIVRTLDEFLATEGKNA